MLVIWDVQTGKGLCGKTIGHEPGNQIKFLNNYDNKLLIV